MTQAEPKLLQLLVIEDSDDDAILICEELRRGGYKPALHRVEGADELKKALDENQFDIIISDYSLPEFDALRALKIVQSTGKDVPVIVVSGSVRESTIVDVMRAGARDYVMKENLTRLPLAVGRELDEAADRRRRRQFEEQLRHTQRLESLGVLAGGVAHDFNNLLTGILGNVSLAAGDASVNPQIRPLLEHALQAAEQAANLTRQMLAYAGKGQFFIEKVDISSAVRDIGALLHASVDKNINLVFELRDALPAVEADRGQLQQLVMNLVINAAEAIVPDQPGTVIVSTEMRELNEAQLHDAVVRDNLEPGQYVCMEVRDTGHGMDGETRRRIFDPFFTTKFTGRGLGLSAVMGIVRSHNGAIRVKSEPGKGARFTVYLPPAETVKPGAEKPTREGAGQLDGVVLVIDDEEVIRSASKAILERGGMHVVLADTGHAGVESFRRLSDRVSLVLLDLTMPLMNGNDVLREIQSIRRSVPVIVSSGYNEAEAMHRITAGQVSGFIQKPYTSAQLLQKVRSALEAAVRRPPPQ